MISRILYSISYRLNKLNKKLIKGSGNKLLNDGKFIGCTIEIFGNDNLIVVEKDSIVKNTLICIRGNNVKVEFKKNSQIKSGEIYAEDNFVNLSIGSHTTIENAVISVCEDNSKITIGNDCMIANYVEIRNSDSHAIFDFEDKRINVAQDILIKDHVWIGNRSVILKGVTLETNSIVGTMSVVTKDVGSNEIVAGNPAKCIKENIKWTRARK